MTRERFDLVAHFGERLRKIAHPTKPETKIFGTRMNGPDANPGVKPDQFGIATRRIHTASIDEWEWNR